MGSGLGCGPRSNPALSVPALTRALHSHTRATAAAVDTPLASTQAPTKTAFDSRLIADIEVPREANIVIVGGGVIGCSIASEQTQTPSSQLEARELLTLSL